MRCVAARMLVWSLLVLTWACYPVSLSLLFGENPRLAYVIELPAALCALIPAAACLAILPGPVAPSRLMGWAIGCYSALVLCGGYWSGIPLPRILDSLAIVWLPAAVALAWRESRAPRSIRGRSARRCTAAAARRWGA